MNITQQKEKTMEQFENNFIENDLMIFTKQTADVFLKQKNNSELIALYFFYYYTAKWQKTNQPKCTTNYVANALHWDIRKVRKAKKQLIELGLIEDVRKIDPETKKVVGYYIKMNYIFKKETVKESLEILEESQGCKNALLGEKARGAICHRVAICTTNALSTNNINALSTNKINKEKEIYKEKEIPSFSLCVFDSEFSKFWSEYPRKEKKDRAKKAFLKKRKAGLEFNTILDGLERHKQKWTQENTKLKYIPHPASWINDERWNDEIVISKNEGESGYNINSYEQTMDVFDVQVKKEEEEKKKQEQEQAKLKEIIARDHDKNVERYGVQDAEDLEMSESIEEYYEVIDDYERRMSKGLLPNGEYPPELSYLENNLFEDPEEEARVIEVALSGARRL